MKIIKFRQLLQNNKFHYWGFIDGSFVGPMLSDGVDDAEVHSEEFTGRKATRIVSENETIVNSDIYAGDLVKGKASVNNTSPGWFERGESSLVEIDFVSEVYWDKEEAKFTFNSPQSYYWETDGLNDRWEEIQIVGDIHHNPELLNLTKKGA